MGELMPPSALFRCASTRRREKKWSLKYGFRALPRRKLRRPAKHNPVPGRRGRKDGPPAVGYAASDGAGCQGDCHAARKTDWREFRNLSDNRGRSSLPAAGRSGAGLRDFHARPRRAAREGLFCRGNHRQALFPLLYVGGCRRREAIVTERILVVRLGEVTGNAFQEWIVECRNTDLPAIAVRVG